MRKKELEHEFWLMDRVIDANIQDSGLKTNSNLWRNIGTKEDHKEEKEADKEVDILLSFSWKLNIEIRNNLVNICPQDQ